MYKMVMFFTVIFLPMTMNDNENILFDHNIQIYITDVQ